MACPIPRTAEALAAWAEELRSRTLWMIADLSDADLYCKELQATNPFLWEIGHVGWFHERFLLRAAEEPSLRADADELFDSMEVEHDSRWMLQMPTRADVLAYIADVHGVLQAVLENEGAARSAEDIALWQLCLFHEEMHVEAFLYMRQTLGYCAPPGIGCDPPGARGPRAEGDAVVPAGVYRIGAERDEAFCFDNERWVHDVELDEFRIARALVTQTDFQQFVDAGGYADERLWTAEGREFRARAEAHHPRDWRKQDGGWERRCFNHWMPLDERLPMIGVSWFEAQAYCSWAGRRLPTEEEWEAAASFDPNGGRRRYPWGDEVPDENRAVLDALTEGVCDVQARTDGDSALGLRQLIGNVWEWTDSDFVPYAGFSPATYEAYSKPWFGTRKVLRGGAWSTSSKLARNTHRNFFQAWRRDVPSGFRSCAP